MSTVRIVCARCNRELAVISDNPGPGEQEFPPEGHPAWSDPQRVLFVHPCRKHLDIGDGTLDEANAERASKGLPPMDVSWLESHAIRWSELRNEYLKARGTGRAAVYRVEPRGRL